jgi:hypothetical protein
MNLVTLIELRDDPLAHEYVKVEEVTVSFASEAGAVDSREGSNRFEIGDALIVGSTGDRWSVSRARFDAKYEPISPIVRGQAGRYRSKRVPVLAKQMPTAFSLARSEGGDVIHGKAGDWLMQYAPGDFGIVEESKFAKVYRRA